MLPPKPKHRGAMASTDPENKLPSVDPIKREVSTPAAPSNDTGNAASSYIAPPPPSDAEFAAHRAKHSAPQAGDALTNSTPNNTVGYTPAPAEKYTIDSVGGGALSKTNGRDISQVITATDKGVGVDSPQLRRRIEDAFGIPGSTEELSDETKSILSEEAAIAVGSPDAKIVIDGLDKAIRGDDVQDAKAITALINRVAGAEGTMAYLDLSAQAALVKGVSDKLIEWGAPDLLDKLIESMGDVKEQQAMWEEMARRSAQQSNLSMVKHYGERMGQQRRTAIADDIIKLVVSNYRLRKDVSTKAQGNEIIEVLDLYDNRWHLDKYDLTSTNLHYFLKANDTVIDCLLRTKHRISAQAARQIEKVSIDTMILNMFPKLGMV